MTYRIELTTRITNSKSELNSYKLNFYTSEVWHTIHALMRYQHLLMYRTIPVQQVPQNPERPLTRFDPTILDTRNRGPPLPQLEPSHNNLKRGCSVIFNFFSCNFNLTYVYYIYCIYAIFNTSTYFDIIIMRLVYLVTSLAPCI